MSNVTNIKIIEGVNDQASEIAFWISEGLCLMIGLVSIFGNGLVLYVSTTKMDTGRFQHVNSVVKHLATSDFLFGIIGVPLLMLWWWWGKKLYKYFMLPSLLFDIE